MALAPHLVEQIDSSVPGGGERELQRLRRRLVARKHALLADLALKLGDAEQAERQLRRARTLDPAERSAARMLRRLEQERGSD